MGNNDSKLPRADPQMHHFLITFQPPDRLKLALADDDTLSIIRRTCHDSWPSGLQADTRCNDGSYKLKFSGRPFSNHNLENNSSNSNQSNPKLLILKILNNLHEFGWRLVLASELTRDAEASTWFFRRHFIIDPPLTPTKKNIYQVSKNRFFCLALHSNDKLQLIGAPDSVKETFHQTVLKLYKPGIEEEKQPNAQFFELKLRGKPWWNDVDTGGDSNGPLEARKLVLQLIKRFRKSKYKIYGVGNMGDTSHCIYFMENVSHDFIDDEDDDRLCLISLYDDDGLLLIDADDAVINATKAAIMDSWPGGVHYEKLQTKNR